MNHYNPRSEKSLVKLFPSLAPVQALDGVYTSELPGPRFLLFFKKVFLILSGLPGWGGKRFMGKSAVNLITRRGQVAPGPRMKLFSRPSGIDGKPGLVAIYEPTAPFLWRHCTDEFRALDDDTVLGMSRFDLPGLRGMPVMFILHRSPQHPATVFLGSIQGKRR